LKSTRRIEIIRYSRRVIQPVAEVQANAKASFERSSVIDTGSMTLQQSPPAPEGNADGQPVKTESPPKRRPWFWVPWLMGE